MLDDSILDLSSSLNCSGDFIGSYIVRNHIRFPVFKGSRGGYFAIDDKGKKIYLTSDEKIELKIQTPKVNQNSSHVGVYTYIDITSKSGEIFKVYKTSENAYYYVDCNGTRKYLSNEQRSKILSETQANPTFPGAVFIGKYHYIQHHKLAIFLDTWGLYFYIFEGSKHFLTREQINAIK